MTDCTRRKAVWGSTWTLPVLLATLFAGLASNATAASRHAREGQKKPSGVPGAQLPAEFKKFARQGRLEIINGQVLDGNQRVTKLVDFVGGRTLPYDDNGHGSHVAGVIAGNGYDSRGEKAGIAPNASLVSLKVLDRNGEGTIGHIIAALNWMAANAQTYNIKVVNLSVGAGIHESYWTDPLTLAAKAVVDQGITVVAAAGNLGKNAAGAKQCGGITAPGNAPWVLTVGASSTMGTLTRNNDTMAGYSSRGPTFVDFAAKPDLVAPGTGTVSLAVPGSTFYATKSASLLAGRLPRGYKPYLSLSGTCMAAPVVTSTVALMLQANPALTPNLIKAMLQYTSQVYAGYIFVARALT